MNEKIKQLVEQAPYTTISTEGRLFSQQDLAKFAELIVLECAEFTNEHNSEVEGVTLGVGRALKKHFGVEE
jgi:hypothetical protein